MKGAQSQGGQSTPFCGARRRGNTTLPLNGKNRRHGWLAFFSTFRPAATAAGCASPFEHLDSGVCERREQTLLIVFIAGEAQRRGGGTIQAAAVRRHTTLYFKAERPRVGECPTIAGMVNLPYFYMVFFN